jgi:GntR family transcriptional regulator/MocR family aminotransferase
VRFDFFPGHPDLGAFPRAAWARATRDALREIPDAALGYSDPRGQRELRVAIAAMIARTRGVVCRPRQVVICQGAAQALGLLVQAASATRRRPPQIAIEDPYLPEHRDLLAFHGADLVPVPVDELGVHDEAIVAARCDHALLTPAHQCPTGAVLSAGRRAAIARWAQGEDVLLIEDDYDAEYRYNRAPVAALQALAPESVAYLGSASKTLAPAVRLAWLVVPQDRLEAVVQAKRYADAGSPAIDQAVFARLIASGGYDRHLRKARRRQAERRDALVAAVARYLPQARVEGAAAGLHAVVRLPAPVDAEQVRERALTRGVSVYPLSAWYADPPPETSRLVLGYGGLTPPAIAEGVRRLSEAVADSS